jgi:hypothetical protein
MSLATDLLLESVRRSISLILRIGLPENRTHFSGRCSSVVLVKKLARVYGAKYGEFLNHHTR